MHYRKLGRTELKVSEIGYGTNMLGRQDLTESEHIAMVTSGYGAWALIVSIQRTCTRKGGVRSYWERR